MYYKKMQSFKKITVGELIDILEQLPKESQIFICGQENISVYVNDEIINLDTDLLDLDYSDSEEYTPSSNNGDYSPSNPWDAPGMSISDFI